MLRQLVYVVVYQYWDDANVEAVFGTERRAQNYIKRQNKINQPMLRIEKHEVK